MKSILVIFGKDPPKKNKKWWQQFDEVLGPKEVEGLTDSGSVQEAYQLVSKLSNLTLSDGRKLPKLITYKGYELWWINYDAIHERFCLPYTQYRNLLLYLKDFEKIYLFQPLWPDLFSHFLKAHNRQCVIFRKFRLRNLLPIPFGVFIQLFLSVLFLPWLKFRGGKPQAMVWTSDKFDPPRDHNFRVKFIYEELHRKKVPFTEFIRSVESWRVVLEHAWKRKRPVFYSAAVIYFIYYFTGLFNKKSVKGLPGLETFSSPEERFWFLVAAHRFSNIKGCILSIRIMQFVLRWLKIKVAYMSKGCDRNLHELLACKLCNIETIGIQHGLAPKSFAVSDFMPGFDGKKMLSVDKYGLWSEWWRDYYIKNSNAYKLEQLFVSGPMRPLETKFPEGNLVPTAPLKVLFISEGLAAPREVMPYLSALLEAKEFNLHIKFRPYRDGFELWLKDNQPEVYKEISEKTKIFRGAMEEAVGFCDVVVGSHSTAVLESLLQLKPFVFYRTQKWGDYYGIKANGPNNFFAENPKELVEHINKSIEIPKEEIKKLQEQFFGNPYQNGSKWVVEQLIKYL